MLAPFPPGYLLVATLEFFHIRFLTCPSAKKEGSLSVLCGLRLWVGQIWVVVLWRTVQNEPTIVCYRNGHDIVTSTRTDWMLSRSPQTKVASRLTPIPTSKSIKRLSLSQKERVQVKFIIIRLIRFDKRCRSRDLSPLRCKDNMNVNDDLAISASKINQKAT